MRIPEQGVSHHGPEVASLGGTAAERHSKSAEPWQVLTSPGAVRFDVPSGWRAGRALQRKIRSLPPGTVVALCGGGTRGRWRRFASGAGLRVEREYLVFPSLHTPHYLVDDGPRAVTYFWSTLLTVPPGSAMKSALASAFIFVTRALAPWPLVRALTPVRLAVARRR